MMTTKEMNDIAVKAIEEWNAANMEPRVVKIGDNKWQVVSKDEVMCVCLCPHHALRIAVTMFVTPLNSVAELFRIAVAIKERNNG